MPISFTCQTCATAYRLPDTAVAGGPLRVRCARCRSIFTVGGPAPAPPPGPEPAHELGPLPHDEVGGLGPALGALDAAGAGSSTAGGARPPGRPAWPEPDQLSPLAVGGRTGPGPWLSERPGASAAVSGSRPFRRLPPSPAAGGRRAFLIGLGGVVGLAVAGRLAWGAWQQRDWLAFLRGDPFPVEVARRRALTGRAGPIYVVEGTVRNLTGSPKGFFEVRGRLLDRDGQPLAEQVVHAGTVLEEAELKALTRADLQRRFEEARLGDDLTNTRVPPRGEIRFQVVFVPAPPSAKIARAEVELAGVKDVP